MKPRKVLFVVNPNAGRRKPEHFLHLIQKNFPPNFPHKIVFWKVKNDFGKIKEVILAGEYSDVVAVGGDGTVNEVAKTIFGKDIRLGIVPLGSGNGLARSLAISPKVEEALLQIVIGKEALIDTGAVNGRPFFCTSGLGFDAHIGELFATSTRRGLSTYIKITLSELFRYRAKEYRMTFNGTTITRKAFLVTVANAGQYGNDFYIAPGAKLSDGKFHIAVLKPFKFWQAFEIFSKIIARKADSSQHIDTYVSDALEIRRATSGTIHYDGEPACEGDTVNFTIRPASLRVIVGDSFSS